MRPQWFGDSFDIVKRFFACVLSDAGFQLTIDGRYSGDWNGAESAFEAFVKPDRVANQRYSALLIDPDTGIGRTRTEKHVTITEIVGELSIFDLVFVFDQSFSRRESPKSQMSQKLSEISRHGANAFYYDSHARFLFSSKERSIIRLCKHLILKSGLPTQRIYDSVEA